MALPGGRSGGGNWRRRANKESNEPVEFIKEDMAVKDTYTIDGDILESRTRSE